MFSFNILRKKELIRTKLSEIIRREVDNPVISNISITDIQIDKKLQRMVVLVSSYGSDPVLIERELNNAGSFIRKKLFKSLHVKSVPSLLFKYDKGFEYSSKIDDILNRLNKVEKPLQQPREEHE